MSDFLIDDEDYPGQRREYERQQIIEKAVSAADQIILNGSLGSKEETDWLTARVAKAFFEKVESRLYSELLRIDLESRGKK